MGKLELGGFYLHQVCKRGVYVCGNGIGADIRILDARGFIVEWGRISAEVRSGRENIGNEVLTVRSQIRRSRYLDR